MITGEMHRQVSDLLQQNLIYPRKINKMRSLLIKNEHLQRKCYVSIGETFKNHMHSHNLSARLWNKSQQ